VRANPTPDAAKFGRSPQARSLDYAVAGSGAEGVRVKQVMPASTPAGKAMFQMMGVFAEFERSMIRERVNAGFARAVAEGTKLGRPKIDKATEAAIRDALQRATSACTRLRRRVRCAHRDGAARQSRDDGARAVADTAISERELEAARTARAVRTAARGALSLPTHRRPARRRCRPSQRNQTDAASLR
jgi:hypothetical protein